MGRRTTTTLGSSYTDYGFDNASRLTTLTQRFAGNSGNSTQSLSYNPASQITSETRDNDAFAFPTNQIGSVDRAYAANSLNQYTSAGPVTFSYDANGNLTSDGSRTYSYDAENRLVSAVSGGVTTNLAYDPLGRLFQVDQGTSGTTTRFLYDGAELAAEYDGSNAMTKRYYFGPGDDEPMIEDTGGALNCSGTKFLHPNQQGSIIALADCWGNQTNINSYDEYGIPASSTGRFQYTGQMWIPELGMSYYKNRVYSPTLGRFLQTDPIGYADSSNLYAYVGNDAVNFADSLGLAEGPLQGQDHPDWNSRDCTGTRLCAWSPSGVAQLFTINSGYWGQTGERSTGGICTSDPLQCTDIVATGPSWGWVSTPFQLGSFAQAGATFEPEPTPMPKDPQPKQSALQCVGSSLWKNRGVLALDVASVAASFVPGGKGLLSAGASVVGSYTGVAAFGVGLAGQSVPGAAIGAAGHYASVGVGLTDGAVGLAKNLPVAGQALAIGGAAYDVYDSLKKGGCLGGGK